MKNHDSDLKNNGITVFSSLIKAIRLDNLAKRLRPFLKKDQRISGFLSTDPVLHLHTVFGNSVIDGLLIRELGNYRLDEAVCFQSQKTGKIVQGPSGAPQAGKGIRLIVPLCHTTNLQLKTYRFEEPLVVPMKKGDVLAVNTDVDLFYKDQVSGQLLLIYTMTPQHVVHSPYKKPEWAKTLPDNYKKMFSPPAIAPQYRSWT